MNIARNNYEEFFMLYADNELTAAQRKDVEAFIAANPDLQHELELFQQFKAGPDAAIVFDNKAVLLKPETGHLNITANDCESFFVLYADNELADNDKAAVEDFVYRHPQLQETFELLQQVTVHPDNSIVFENKKSLYRKEEDDRVIPFPWRRLAAAAALILFVSIFWLNSEKKIDHTGVAKNQPAKPVHEPLLQKIKDTTTGRPANKNTQPGSETIAVTDGIKQNPQVNKASHSPAVAQQLNKENDNNDGNSLVLKKDEVAAAGVKNNVILPINEKPAMVDIVKPLIAAAKTPIIDQPAIVLHPDEDDRTKAVFASLNDDNVEVLNTSVNTKSSLRGFFRKASRLIAKKTNAGNESNNHKGILIGGFEIAVR
jgi:hypothetical protein